MLISFLLFLLLTSIQVKAACSPKAQDIPVYKQGAHLGTRTTEPSVTASLDDEKLTVNVSHYLGVAKEYIYNDSGSLVTSMSHSYRWHRTVLSGFVNYGKRCL